MKLLILGGTLFLGRHLVDVALARGHEVTLFNRGRTAPDLFPDLERLRGDRDGDLAALRGRRWDAVVDTSGRLPRHVRASAGTLAGGVARYIFISTISVYAGFSRPGMDESAPTGTLADEESEEQTGATYGPLKALCEREAEAAMPGRTLVLRPGLIVGPHDPTDRFTYWPRRVARGGEVLAPGRPDRPVQFIDARDLAGWAVRMAETGGTGVYNATGPADPLTLGRLLDACNEVGGGDARFTWVDEGFLLAEGVGPWMELPLWVPDTPEMAGFAAVDCRKAIAAGLTFRPLADTIRATLDWDATRSSNHEWRAGLAPAREAHLLAAWHRRPAATA
ncbi:MAG: SDR family oxidoreductase [Chloroflexota bacterium]|nr:SDR family oxidoreductase [Chloroflexota bacterium]